nr:hypothetical protein [Microbacterium galbinum]
MHTHSPDRAEERAGDGVAEAAAHGYIAGESASTQDDSVPLRGRRADRSDVVRAMLSIAVGRDDVFPRPATRDMRESCPQRGRFPDVLGLVQHLDPAILDATEQLGVGLPAAVVDDDHPMPCGMQCLDQFDHPLIRLVRRDQDDHEPLPAM